MNDSESLTAILAELKGIRALLASQGANPGATAARPAAQPTQYAVAQTPDGPPPQPTTVVENAASQTIHFGKNNGKTLGELTEKSLGWYASVKEPRLDSSGKPFPPRPQDVALEQAARTLWHRQNGTLVESNSASERHTAPPVHSTASAEVLDEEVPF